MSTVIGIDLGTTNTVVSVMRDGQASALNDDAQQTLIPSVVSFHPNGNVLVGRPAKERRIVDSANTIYSIKRLIGRSWASEEVRRARARFPFEMREGPGQAALVVARGETYTLPEISAFVLRKAKSVAEAALGTTVDRAVITVPANFNDLQRAATKVAGRVAGLEVMRILNEPTAAALAYGYGRSSSERIVVYDFGGGTFDVTLLDLSNNVFEVLATAGNTFLGGDDLDIAIAERMSELLLAQHRLDAHSDSQIFERLRAVAETVKHRLSTDNEVRVTVNEVGHGVLGRTVDFEFSMTRGELERLAASIVDRTFDVCREAMGIAGLSSNDFDQVLLVGGSTRIPLVQRRVEEFFKKPLRASINPDEAVAIGAAIQAAALSGAERRRGTVPPAPSPASRQTQPNFSDAQLSAADARSRSSQPTGVPAVRPHFESSPAIPSTQPFFGRPHVSTHPGLQPGASARSASTGTESTLGALGKATSNPAPSTLGGLGPRGRVKTGSGLGPEVTRAVANPTLVSATHEAERAREAFEEESGLPLVGAKSAALPPLKPELDVEQVARRFGNLHRATPAPREDSVAVALGDADLIELESAPAPLSSRGLDGYGPSTPSRFELEVEDALPLPEIPDEEITRVTEPNASRPAHAFSGKSSSFGNDNAAHAAGGAEAPARYVPSAPGAWPSERASPPSSPIREALAPSFASTSLGATPDSVRAPRSLPPAPLLIDVTPLTLAVETVNGFCDTVIERNMQVPCERTRVFVTATDNQTLVRVRISQGESSRFDENTLLGEIELTSLNPAPRGEVQIAVSFSLDTNGMLNVSAKEVATGRATTARVRLVALPEAHDVNRLMQRNAARQI